MRKSICGTFDRTRAALRNLIDLMQYQQLAGVRHRESHLLLARHLLLLRLDRKCRDTEILALRQVSHFDTHMADSAQRHDLALRFVAHRIAAHGKFQRVAVGIEDKKRFFDRRRFERNSSAREF